MTLKEKYIGQASNFSSLSPKIIFIEVTSKKCFFFRKYPSFLGKVLPPITYNFKVVYIKMKSHES